MSKAMVTALVVAAGLLGGPAAANGYSLEAHCESPPLGPVDDCTPWHTSDVRLTWSWSPNTETETSGCETRTFTADTPPAGIPQTCSVTWSTMKLEATAYVRVDKTRPAITGAVPSRAPDHNGWWTHPVDFSFQGSDEASGIAGCDTVTYAGPDGRGVAVEGSCRDVAGNSATATRLIDYDATPPAIDGRAVARSGATAQGSWQAPGAVTAEVVRSGDGKTSTVYSGPAAAFNDAGLSAAATYTYTVTVFDDAGNAATASTTAAAEPLPGASRLTPQGDALLTRPPLLRWKRVRRASYYNVQLYRGGHKILSAWPRRNRLQLHSRWHYGNRRHHLARGTYRWYVWPGRGRRAARHYGKLIGTSTFRFGRRLGGAAIAYAAQDRSAVAPDPAPVKPDPAPVKRAPPPVTRAPAPRAVTAAPGVSQQQSPLPSGTAAPRLPQPNPAPTRVPRKSQRAHRERRRRPAGNPQARPLLGPPTFAQHAPFVAAGIATANAIDDNRLLLIGFVLLALVVLDAAVLRWAVRVVGAPRLY